MRKRLIFGSGLVLLAILVTLVVWQGSFSFGPFAPSSVEQTFIFWAVSTIIFILTVALGFMLFRTGVKLYVERRNSGPGSRIKSKLIGGAFALSFLPVFFLVLWSVSVLNFNLDKWFSRPGENIKNDLVDIGSLIDRQVRDRLVAEGRLLAQNLNQPGFCREHPLDRIEFVTPGGVRQPVCPGPAVVSRAPLYVETVPAGAGSLTLSTRLPFDLAAKKQNIDRSVGDYLRLAGDKTNFRNLYLLLLSLITLFILFFATWMARYLAGQISAPITALLAAAQQVRRGNLAYRVHVAAIDELATLVRAFNEMTEALETNSRELETRRRFTEAILESIPSGVISLSADGRIQRVNRALMGIFSEEQVRSAARLDDLFSAEDIAEIRYLMNRARRTGVAGTQLEFKSADRYLHLSLTVAAIGERRSAGFVLVVEDTSELLRAQKAAAWHEVARRVAHEIKNPLTPIALCSDRIARQLDRVATTADTTRILRECSATISREVESVRTLVDEFSQFSRFPSPRPEPSDLNEVVENALAVFSGRLEGIDVRKELAPNLPPVNIDCDQFKRVVVNLVDNAAEAMQDSFVKHLYVGTRAAGTDGVEMIITDTGCGITSEDKEKLFLPYFSTKGRGTGLGLAIVNRILADHNAVIRVESNSPAGARFIVEIPALARQNGLAGAAASEARS
jgi:two-component system nitrogen regulation sensor histidine kinase NtrY